MRRDVFRLDNKVVAVIGAAAASGAAVAQCVAAQGARAIRLDRQAETAQSLAAGITADGGAAEHGALDINDEAAVSACLDGIVATHGRLDGLVCTPAINVRKPLQPTRARSSTAWWR